MICGPVAVCITIASLVCGAPPAANGPSPGAPTDGGTRPAASPSRDGRMVELTGLYFVETWDFNGRARDALAGAAAGVSLPIGAARWSVLLELAGIHVEAPRSADALVVGPSALLRMRIGRHGRATFFAEIGAGPSYATRTVPDRGTRFNYLLQAGGGLRFPLGRHVGAIIDLRHFHLSNGSLNGSGHNPDIQALGGHVGMWVGF